MPSLDDLLQQATARAAAPARPESTYRLQFHKDFTFRDATAIIEYLHELGVTHAYASPYFRATPGSSHGYDVIDHNRLNPEIGTYQEYEEWVNALGARGMSHILDVVPNHVGVATGENLFWHITLMYGRRSPLARYLDIAWDASPRPALHGKVLLPVLGDHYGNVLERGELRLALEDGRLVVRYYDRRFPIDPVTYPDVFGSDLEEFGRAVGGDERLISAFRGLLDQSAQIAGISPEATQPLSNDETHALMNAALKLRNLATRNEVARQFLEAKVNDVNGTPGEPRTFDRLDRLLNQQNYRLAYWRVAPDESNYRRFFDINDLAALRMEDERVFETTHEFVLSLLAERKITGLRIDHPDGLYDPDQYFRRLQRHYIAACAAERRNRDSWEPGRHFTTTKEALKIADEKHLVTVNDRPLYVLAEKILAVGESLPTEWPIDGTSGYDFLNEANGLFVDTASADAYTRLFEEWTGDATPFGDLVYQKKKLILKISLASELQMLAHRLDRLAQRDRHSRDFTLTILRRALREVIACFPIYRTYISDEGVREADVAPIDSAIAGAMQRNPKLDASVFHYLRDVLLLRYPTMFAEEDRAEQRQFVGKFQQLTAPVTAKGIEDTAFYIYNRLTSLNEVGGDPARFGLEPPALHRYLQQRQQDWPHAMSALSTHDTKRSEDVRARINVLSELPDEWSEHAKRWAKLNEPHRQKLDGGLAAPHPNDEYLLYQSLVGAYPVEPHGEGEYATFIERMQAYMLKAMREAKVRTSWTDANEAYESTMKQFIATILDRVSGRAFLDDFLPFQRRISHFGMLNSLSQTLLRLTAPGVPDTYQGSELWDFSLVDPDNRRPVNYELRQSLLAEIKDKSEAAGGSEAAQCEFARELIEKKSDGRVKLFVTWRTLHARRSHPGLFSSGAYLPLDLEGPQRDHLFAYARQHQGQSAIIVLPRLMHRLVPGERALPLGQSTWHDTRVRLPPSIAQGQLKNLFTGASIDLTHAQSLNIADVLADFPVALLT